MILIILGSVLYLIQMILAMVFLIEGDFDSKKEIKLFLIPYPYWLCVAVIWFIKQIVSQYKRLK